MPSGPEIRVTRPRPVINPEPPQTDVDEIARRRRRQDEQRLGRSSGFRVDPAPRTDASSPFGTGLRIG